MWIYSTIFDKNNVFIANAVLDLIIAIPNNSLLLKN